MLYWFIFMLAAKHHVTVPVIETLYGILKPYENGKPN